MIFVQYLLTSIQWYKFNFKNKIQILRTNNDLEYFNNTRKTYLQENGIFIKVHVLILLGKTKIFERKNRHLLEIACALMFTTNLPQIFLGDATLALAYLINRMPSHTLNFESTLQKLQESFPSSHLISTKSYLQKHLDVLALFICILIIEINAYPVHSNVY